MLKLLLLDFDGTVADTRRANALAYIDALAEAGITLDEQTYTRNYFGMRCDEFLTKIGIDSPQQRLHIRKRKIELYPSHFDSVSLNKPLMAFTDNFRQHGGKAFIVSTGHIDNISNVIKHLKLEGRFDRIISGDDVSNPKPDPECFITAMNLANATPEQTLIFEDSDIGIEAARRSNAAVIRITL